ncbi:MAG: hypothetical protein M3Z21_03555, partial [Pseudomonadota bacterium]|nr:hypothetical protein [Pseudomonadota bacterium]
MASARSLIIGLLLWSWLAGATPALANPVADDLRLRLTVHSAPAGLHAGGEALRSAEAVHRFYAGRSWRPAWLDGLGRPLPAADDLLSVVVQAEFEGLRDSDYHKNAISNALALVRQGYQVTPRQLADLDLLLTDAFLTYAGHMLMGRVSPHAVDDAWSLQPRHRDLTAVLQQALDGNRVAQGLLALAPTHPGYARLRLALQQHLAIARAGGWAELSPGAMLRPGDRGARVRELRARLRLSGDHGPQPVLDEDLFDVA